MEKTITCLIKAFERLGLPYEDIDKKSNFIKAKLCGRWEYFQLNKTPFNSEVHYSICRDKMHSYQLLSGVVRMPTTLAFLDFHIDAQYHQYLQHRSPEQALTAIEHSFSYPLVIKQNQGALGENVYLCADRQQVIDALAAIFNPASKCYDYLALAQAYVPTQEEYRLICAFGEPVLAYRRGQTAGFNARYWQKGEQASLIDDAHLIEQLHQFVKPIYQHLAIGLAGFDIIRTPQGEYYLIEINSSPKVNNVIAGNGEDCVIAMYEKILTLYSNRHSS